MSDYFQTFASAPPHGGDLAYATRVFGEPADGWQDLSTGISPWSYPVPELPGEVWQRLPGDGRALGEAAARYYGLAQNQLIPLPGSQYAIARIPGRLPAARVALPALGYAEHHHAWASAGHIITLYRDVDQLSQLVRDRRVEHLVIINPNNPSAETITRKALGRLYDVHDRRGLMLVDEAFVDVQPALSAVPLIERCPDLWVLRSMGKFFGLAGLRLGFLLGRGGRFPLDNILVSELQPWGISHPAQWVGELALNDRAWQTQQRDRLRAASREIEALWRGFFSRQPVFGRHTCAIDNGGLFVTLRGEWESLYQLYGHLGRSGVLLRWCHWSVRESGRAWLRCGLPLDGGERLRRALMELVLEPRLLQADKVSS